MNKYFTGNRVNSNKNKKKRDFNKMYEEFMLKKKMHEQALMILRQNKDKNYMLKKNEIQTKSNRVQGIFE